MAGINFCRYFIRNPSRSSSSSKAKKNRKAKIKHGERLKISTKHCANASRAPLRKFLLIELELPKLCLELMGRTTRSVNIALKLIKIDLIYSVCLVPKAVVRTMPIRLTQVDPLGPIPADGGFRQHAEERSPWWRRQPAGTCTKAYGRTRIRRDPDSLC